MRLIPVIIFLLIASCKKSSEPVLIRTDHLLPYDSSTYTIGNDGRYNSFGNLFIKDSENIALTIRSGTDHLANGRIDWMNYNIDSAKWSPAVTIAMPETGYDFRDPRASVAGDKIILFT